MSYIAIIIMGFTNRYFQMQRGKCSPKIRYFPSSTSRSSYSFHMKWNEIRMWIYVYNMFMAFKISKYCVLIKYYETKIQTKALQCNKLSLIIAIFVADSRNFILVMFLWKMVFERKLAWNIEKKHLPLT